MMSVGDVRYWQPHEPAAETREGVVASGRCWPARDRRSCEGKRSWPPDGPSGEHEYQHPVMMVAVARFSCVMKQGVLVSPG